MDAFIDAFLAVDQNGSGTITIPELRNYVQKNNLDSKMITQWQTLFDPEGTGEITLQKFCDVLGLREAEVRNRFQQSAPRLRKEVRVISGTMSLDDQMTVSEEAFRLLEGRRLAPAEMADRLKQFLDRRYGRMWHVVITKGSNWSSFSHSQRTSFFFQIYEYNYLLWRTPE
ncbi:unnamed protein product [Calicophoron daubneyi]|uniref:EF-hand domain-containing protein n=1 Tax=Calicophoron daubneyi TaxID=300641 RepID=A0AAV2T4Z2_CALDB